MMDDFGGNPELDGMARRLKLLVKNAGGNQKVAARADVPLSTLNTILAGKTDPRLSTLARLSPALGVPISALIEAAGDEDNTKYRTDSAVHIPLRDVYASAGPGAEVFDEAPKDFLSFSRHFVEAWGRSHAHVEAIRVIGDSMEPTIMNGAIVLIDRADRTLVEGRIYAFRTPDGLRLKRFQRAIDGAILLVSDNEIYAPERIDAADMNDLRVAGRVFWTERLV